MTPLVELVGAGVSLGGRDILQGVDLSLDAGQVAGVSGPNGSGKTTLLRALASLTRIDSGSGTLLGADIRTDEVYTVRPWIAFIGHIPSLIGALSLTDNLRHAVRLRAGDEGKIQRVLDVVGLGDAASVSADASSFGTQRRLEVARVLLSNPRLLLLDEAFSGLDEAAQSLIDALITRTVGNGGGVVMVSHDDGHLRDRSDLHYRIEEGRVEVTA